MKVKLIKDSLGIYRRADAIGEVIDISEEVAKEMINSGHAEKVEVKASKKED